MEKDSLIILCVCLSFACFVLCCVFLVEVLNHELEDQYDEGYYDGQNETSLTITYQIMKLAAECQPIPLTYMDNSTLNLIAVECLQQGEQQ